MRTTEERCRLVQKRTAEIKQVQHKQKQAIGDSACMAACLLLVVCMGVWMPTQMAGNAAEDISHISGAASMIGDHAALGYIVMGVLSFLLGVCVTILLYRLRERREQNRREGNKDEL